VIKLCYVLAYRDPHYIRTLSLLDALALLPNVELYIAINRSRGCWRYIETLWQVLSIKQRYRPDCYLLGFRGHELFWPLRWLIGRKPLIFDSLMSPHAALSEDRKFGCLGRIISYPWYFVEKALLRRADSVLTDTQLHVEFLANRFQLCRSSIYAVPIGAVDRSLHSRDLQLVNQPFKVLFYGSFLPLHGMIVILRAAALLRDLPIFFTFIGGGDSSLIEFEKLCRSLQLKKLEHLKWVDFDELLDHYIPEANLCLGGPFGDTPQARRVVTGKTVQCLAMKKATIVGGIAENFGFIDKYNCLLVKQGDPVALAADIEWAYLNRDQLVTIGERGANLYQENFSSGRIAKVLKMVLAKLDRSAGVMEIS
jgi:glycosyltransferase involved in cell wall biosynthesis